MFILFISVFSWSQENETFKSENQFIELSSFYGSVLPHSPDIFHLIRNHPTGFILGYNRKTDGTKSWEEDYNYPDVGYSFIYEDMHNEVLGKHFSLYTHYNFYLLNRNLQLRFGTGLSYTTNPYDKETNFRNNAYGSTILATAYLQLAYKKEKIYKNLGVKAGFSFIHYSNGNFKTPNTSTNTLALTAGLVYNLNAEKEEVFLKNPEKRLLTESFKGNVIFRSGFNESDLIGSDKYPFYIVSAYIDKRISRKSALQFGADVFFSKFLKEFIKYKSIAFPALGVQADDDYRRVGLFIGHELFVNRFSIITQLGYYVYYPFDFEGRMYNRIGFKRYFGDKYFGVVSLKTHAAAAEAIELGIGIRF